MLRKRPLIQFGDVEIHPKVAGKERGLTNIHFSPSRKRKEQKAKVGKRLLPRLRLLMREGEIPFCSQKPLAVNGKESQESVTQ